MLLWLSYGPDAPEPAGDSTLEQVEREHIIRVLRDTGGSSQQSSYSSRDAPDDIERAYAKARNLSQGSVTPCIQRTPLRFTHHARNHHQTVNIGPYRADFLGPNVRAISDRPTSLKTSRRVGRCGTGHCPAIESSLTAESARRS